MTCLLADNILSPLGTTTADNLEALIGGRSALRRQDDPRRLLAPHTASLFPERLSFEELAMRSAREALFRASVNLERTVFILSTTKGSPGETPGETALRIAQSLGITTTPITVCNACVSGLSALILGQRLLDSGVYDYAVVTGADVQTDFIVSGFQSLRALSTDPCRPFDMERTGLNLGEAAATVVLGPDSEAPGAWRVAKGSVHNDAFHTTQPDRRGDGLRRCLVDVTAGWDPADIALINAHGTATLFNDQMEAVAIARAGLAGVRVNGLKGYYGHTLGAAGLLETILTAHALDRGLIPGTRGYAECGVSEPLLISPDHQPSAGRTFVKTISGFGGCNAAVLMTKDAAFEKSVSAEGSSWRTAATVDLTPDNLSIGGEDQHQSAGTTAGLTALYKQFCPDYPHFYRMDPLSRLGHVAAELLLQSETALTDEERDSRAVILFNRSSSAISDARHLESIAQADNFFPSPSTFIYTLPNIVTGEIAIRHRLHGETSFFILPGRDEHLEQIILGATLPQTTASSVITGWIDAADEHHFEAHLRLLKR